MSGRTNNRTVSGRWTPGVSGNPATRFRPCVSGNAKGRPRTKILRDICGRIAEEKDQKSQRRVAEQLARVLVKFALRGSLGRWQQLLQLIESDSPSTGWPGSDHFDGDAINRLIAKLCR
jgi:hypothetical protein